MRLSQPFPILSQKLQQPREADEVVVEGGEVEAAAAIVVVVEARQAVVAPVTAGPSIRISRPVTGPGAPCTSSTGARRTSVRLHQLVLGRMFISRNLPRINRIKINENLTSSVSTNQQWKECIVFCMMMK